MARPTDGNPAKISGRRKVLGSNRAAKYGHGFGVIQRRTMRQFYLLYPAPGKIQSSAGKSEIRQSVIDEFTRRSSKRLSRAIEQLGRIARAFPLPWTHYVRLLRVRNALAREFYAREALACGWSVRQLIFVKLNR